jgi:hypothetical protein
MRPNEAHSAPFILCNARPKRETVRVSTLGDSSSASRCLCCTLYGRVVAYTQHIKFSVRAPRQSAIKGFMPAPGKKIRREAFILLSSVEVKRMERLLPIVFWRALASCSRGRRICCESRGLALGGPMRGSSTLYAIAVGSELTVRSVRECRDTSPGGVRVAR